MDADGTRDRLLLATIAVGFGVLTCLEAYGITELSRGATNTPRWVMVLIGAMFIAAGLIVAFQVRGRLNHFMASLIMASMGAVFAWISFYGNDAGFSGAGSILSELTQIPFDRAMFGLGALFCLCGSAYAFARFVRG